jgi:hypothetical protein
MEPQRLSVWTGNRKVGKAFDEFEAAAESEGRIVVTTPENCRALAVRDAVMRNADAAWLVGATVKEDALSWTHPELGECKGRPDMHKGATLLADLKLMRDASPNRINAAIYSGGIDIQAAWYSIGLGGRPACYVLVVESNPPHACTVVELPPPIIDAAIEYITAVAKAYRVHEMCNSFPGPTPGKMVYEPPSYATSTDVDMEGTESEEV